MNTINVPAGASLDPYLHLHRDPTRFVLGPGEYTTSGAWGFKDPALDCCMVPPGSTLEGAGSNRTIIRFQRPVEPASPYFEALTGGSRSGASTSVTLQGFTLDVSASPAPVVALHLWSDEPRALDICVVGVWGDRTPRAPRAPSEGFGILLNRAPVSRRDGGGLIDGCRVVAGRHPTDPSRENYTCAFYLGIAQRRDVPIVRSRLVDCRATGPRAAGVHAAFASNDFTEMTDCASDDSFIRGWFCDVNGAEDLRVSSCHFESSYAGIDLESGSADAKWRRVSLTDCEFTLNGDPGADHVVAMVLNDLTATRPQAGQVAEFRNVRMKRCRLNNRSAGRGFLASLSGSHTTDCGMSDCELVGRWDPPVRCTGVAPEAFGSAPLL